MSQRTVKVTKTITDTQTHTIPVLFEGALGVFTDEGKAVIFNAALTLDGPPLFDAGFIERMIQAGKISETDEEPPPELLAFNPAGHIPIRGWGFE